MIKPEGVTSAKQNISRLFIQQCEHGRQTTSLPSGLVACGQFVGKGAEQLSQRGLHGSAAALLVLASSTRIEAPSLIAGLISYLEVCFGCREAPAASGDICSIPDTENVIKVAEVLYALEFVKPAAADVSRLREHLVRLLLDSTVDGRGWGYWLPSPQGSVDVIPTAYAVRALATHGYVKEVEGAVRFLWDRLCGPEIEQEASDPMVRTLALFVLSVANLPAPSDLQVSTDQVFRSLWGRLSPLLAVDIEQNLEYTGDPQHRRHEYVRIPWQLYLSALAAYNSPSAFASTALQQRLKAILAAVNQHDGGFRYPHSGNLISSRTNAILFDILTLVETKLRGNPFYLVLNTWDRAWTWLSALLNQKWIRTVTALFALGVAGYSVWSWCRNPESSLSEFAPNILTSMLLFLMANRKAK